MTAFWSVLLLVNFLPAVPQPGLIIGYLWKVEFALALFLGALSVLLARRDFDPKIYSKNELLLIILPLLAFVAWSGLSIFWAESWRFAAHHTLLWACYLIFYLLVRQTLGKPNAVDLMLTLTGTTVFILSAIGVAEYLSTPPENAGDISLRYGKYAEAIVALLPVLIALAAGKKSRRPALFLIFALAGWIGVIASLARTQFLSGHAAAALFFALAVLFARKKIHFKRAALFAAAFLLITVLSQISFSGNRQATTLKRFSADTNNQLSVKVRFLFWRIAVRSFRDHPLTGIGADNFTPAYRTTRDRYVATHRRDPKLIHYEAILPERAHNEYLQILAELGAPGFFLFAAFLAGILWLFLRRRKRSVSLVALAAAAGMTAFLVSSAVSSYSFRVPANGVCFFFLLALFTKEFGISDFGLRISDDEGADKHSPAFYQNAVRRYLPAAAVVVCAAMLVFSGVRGAALYYVWEGSSQIELDAARPAYEKALALDGDDGGAHFVFGQRLFLKGAADEAVPHLRKAIDRGVATTVSYYYLAAAEIYGGRAADAEQTFLEGLRLYPRSVFLRTAYAAFLKSAGRAADAETEYQKAFRINQHQARSWYVAETEGMEKLSLLAATDCRYTETMELKPTAGIYALLDFQQLSNPQLFREKF
ncbi:MAG: O-antigen ligase family protein [Acidobacteria bacterium]|nr:O-antigen ligase family protein [Acidobacteriota bacterium]